MGLAPDGGHFMTVHHGQEDVAFYTWPDGEVTLSVGVGAFGYDPEEAFVEWAGGCLDATTVIVIVGGELQNQREWYHAHLLDTATGQLLGRIEVPNGDLPDIQPLGDGSWLTTDQAGQVQRHQR